MSDSCFHSLSLSVGEKLPELFTYPFHYRPHPLCIKAAEEVKAYIASHQEWVTEVGRGKMFGVLLVQSPTGAVGFLAAFSGILDGKNNIPYFVPPVYDFLQFASYFKQEEYAISVINHKIGALRTSSDYELLKLKLQDVQLRVEAERSSMRQFLVSEKEKRHLIRQQSVDPEILDLLVRESQYQKAEWKRKERNWSLAIHEVSEAVFRYEERVEKLCQERKKRSAELQQWLFKQFVVSNAFGEQRTIYQIFLDCGRGVPPAGTGECAAPKLLQYAYNRGYRPLAMAEFWYGDTLVQELRRHGHFYPSCKSKCEPILNFMLRGLHVEPNPLLQNVRKDYASLVKVLYEDQWLLAVSKPAGMLSVPGKDEQALSVLQWAQQNIPSADGPLLVHRLDMDTSGILLIAKTKEVHQSLQMLFETRAIKKRYIALLEGLVRSETGFIKLPLCPDFNDRPRQMVSFDYGKPAVTRYEVLSSSFGRTRVAFYPQTGRTHQLRIHAAHILGLNAPIVGDVLYGQAADRMYLHAESLTFRHPITNRMIHIVCPSDF